MITSEQLAAILDQNCMSQTKMAEYLGVAPGYISQMKCGRFGISQKMEAKIRAIEGIIIPDPTNPLTAEVNRLEEEITRLQDENAKLSQKNAELKSENGRLNSLIKKLEADNDTFLSILQKVTKA